MRTFWSVDLVMNYYGEWLGNKENAITLMREVEESGGGKSFSSHLRELRQLLIDRYGFSCEDIPFTPTYRRR